MGREKSGAVMMVYIPNSLVEYLSKMENKRAVDKTAHFISVLTFHITSKYPDGEYYKKKQVSNTYFKKHYTSSYFIEVISPLKDDGIIEVNEHWSDTQGFTKGYSLAKMYRDETIGGGIVGIPIRKATLINKIREWRRGTIAKGIEQHPYLAKEGEMLLNIEIDLDRLESLHQDRIKTYTQTDRMKKLHAVNQMNYYKEQIVLLSNAKDILDTQIRLVTGRVYHPLVGCPSEYRKAVVDSSGQPYVEIDLRSSQAVFLCRVIATAIANDLMTIDPLGGWQFKDNIIELVTPLLQDEIPAIESGCYPNDFVQFWADVFTGDIYDEASIGYLRRMKDFGHASIKADGAIVLIPSHIRTSPTKKHVRDVAKESFFRDVFFNYFNREKTEPDGTVVSSSEYLDLFYQRNPTVYQFNKECARQSKERKKKSRDLALLLQRTESKFFHEILPPFIKMQKKVNYFIVHDGIYAPKESVNEVFLGCLAASTLFFNKVPVFKSTEGIRLPFSAD